jgi:6-phosphogluconate dehydrogenase
MNQLGVVGLGTMGANLARNAVRNGATVAVFNRTAEKVEEFVKAHGTEGIFVPCNSFAKLCAALKPPRAILLMVKAGEAVDQVLTELIPLLSKGDILIDGGNSHYRDTEKRQNFLKKKGIHFLGMGVSGGEEGALRGPSMMPGGEKEAYTTIEPLLKKMAAEDGAQGKCVTYIGPDGSGHFVKMVHNGIEYALMQLIAEAYHLLKVEGKMRNADLAKTFAEWNEGDDLQSFLLEITAKIFQKKLSSTEAPLGPNGEAYLIDLIKDSAGQKGTGKWTTEAAFAYGVAVPTITAGVDARIMSSAKEFRVGQKKKIPVSLEKSTLSSLPTAVRSALELSFINTYGQGFQLLSAASTEEKWSLNIPEVARIWRGGCIIRSAILPKYQEMFSGNQDVAKEVRERFSGERQLHWRQVVSLGAERGIPLPAMSASLSYFDSYRSDWLPQNLIQAQRDFFGAHGFERLDTPGMFYGEWD